ncbi:sigma factor [Actinoplanes sp. NPDC023801]|uniref:RNA polymerase sigma factor n=1 Tax=Actinoplanes sp. NPDC023801 TaxID=3154595 RepID=UPI0033CE7367
MTVSPESVTADGGPDLEGLARRAVAGDARALEELCRGLQDLIFRLALRFSSDPEAAADATQEILILVVTHLAEFEGRSKLTTWVYTIASRHLLRTVRGPVEVSVAGPEPFADWLDRNLAPEPFTHHDEAEYRLLAGEVRLACTYGMLLVLSRPLRLAYLEHRLRDPRPPPAGLQCPARRERPCPGRNPGRGGPGTRPGMRHSRGIPGRTAVPGTRPGVADAAGGVPRPYQMSSRREGAP